jgi:modulator of drug activity B
MQGKNFMISATWNAPRGSFDNPNSALSAAREGPTCSSTSRRTTNFATTFSRILGVFDIFKNPDIPRALEDYERHLKNTACEPVSQLNRA